MPSRPWAELLHDDEGKPSVLWRTIRAVGGFVVIVIGVVMIVVMSWTRSDLASTKTDVIDAGERRLARSTTEEVRTQTMECFAHPEQRRSNPTFDDMCKATLARWQVITSSTTTTSVP